MGLGWLLVPALGGYWLLTHLRITRYSVLRDSGYHVFFRAATAGGLLVVVAYALASSMHELGVPGNRSIVEALRSVRLLRHVHVERGPGIHVAVARLVN